MFYVIATYKVNLLKPHYNEVFLVDVSAIHLLLLKQKYEISPFHSAPVEMTYKEKSPIKGLTLIVNKHQTIFILLYKTKYFTS